MKFGPRGGQVRDLYERRSLDECEAAGEGDKGSHDGFCGTCRVHGEASDECPLHGDEWRRERLNNEECRAANDIVTVDAYEHRGVSRLAACVGAARVQFSKAALQAAASKGDVDGDGDRK